MITEQILGILFNLGHFVIDLVPDFSLGGIGSFEGLLDVARVTSYFIPWNALGNALLIWLGFQAFRLAYQMAMWLLKKIPGVD